MKFEESRQIVKGLQQDGSTRSSMRGKIMKKATLVEEEVLWCDEQHSQLFRGMKSSSRQLSASPGITVDATCHSRGYIDAG